MNRPGSALAHVTHRVMAFVGWMTARSRREAVWAALTALSLIAAGDYLTGPHFSFAALYILPMCFAAWSLGSKAGFLAGAFGAAATIFLEGRAGPLQPYGAMAEDMAAVWNAAMRILVVGFIVILVAAFRRSFETERRRGQTDMLTGAYNRQALNARIAATVAIARRHKLTLILAYVDLDGFKGINDTHGHAAGDDVLKTFAAAASASIRQSDSLCRIGGDEFVILMTTASSAHGYAAAEHLHARLAIILEALPYDVTCSMGAVVFEGDAPGEPDHFLEYADALMYEVKKNGKNALRIAHAAASRQPDNGRLDTNINAKPALA